MTKSEFDAHVAATISDLSDQITQMTEKAVAQMPVELADNFRNTTAENLTVMRDQLALVYSQAASKIAADIEGVYGKPENN